MRYINNKEEAKVIAVRGTKSQKTKIHRREKTYLLRGVWEGGCSEKRRLRVWCPIACSDFRWNVGMEREILISCFVLKLYLYIINSSFLRLYNTKKLTNKKWSSIS